MLYIVTDDGETCTFHILVTKLLPRGEIHQDDIYEFAISLICSVEKLHIVGMLYWGIKPANVAWDSPKRFVSLLDFGHAQLVTWREQRRTKELVALTIESPAARMTLKEAEDRLVESMTARSPWNRQLCRTNLAQSL